MTQLLSNRLAHAALPLAFLLTAGAASVRAEEESDSDSDAAPEAIEVAGTIESTRSFEIVADNEHLSDLKVKKIVPFGSEVSEEQTLIWFEHDNLDDQIEKAEFDFENAKLQMKSDEFAYEQFLKTQELDRAQAKRQREIARQDFDNYQTADRERQLESAKFSLKSSEFSLASATEEFEQLKQMYEEDDLTEESEEIVLRRAKHAMESAAFSLKRTQIQTRRTIDQTIPRSDASQETALERALIEYETAMQKITNDKQKRALEIQRKRTEFDDREQSLQEMRDERKRIVLRSPIDGIFLYGKLVRAKLPAKPIVFDDNTSVTGKQVIGTVVDPTRLQVRIDLAEEHLHAVSAGAPCTVTPKGLPEVQFSGTVRSVANVPFVPGKYDCVVSIKMPKDSAAMPAMGCTVRFEVAEEDDE